MEIIDKVLEVCKILDKNKAQNIIYIDTSKKSNIVDFFVIATASSIVHVKSLIDICFNELSTKQIFTTISREGFNNSRWQILDVGEGFVHIFTKEEREKYNIEKMVGEGGNIYSLEKLVKKQKKLKETQAKKESKKTKSANKKPNRQEKVDESRKKRIDKELSKISKNKK